MKPVSFNPSDKLDLRWILLLILVLLIIILAWPNPASGAFFAQTTATPLVTPSATATITPIPVEYLESPDQTSGVICGSVVLILIIVGGTLGILRTKNGNNKH